MKKIKYRISALILLLAILSISTGVTYSAFSSKTTNEKAEIIRAGTVTLELKEKESLNLDDMQSLSDTDGMLSENYYEFTITNTGSSDSNIDIYLIDDQTKLSTYGGILLDKSYIKTSIDEYGVKQAPITLTEKDGLVGTDYLRVGESKSYKLRLWLNFDGLSNEQIDEFYGQKQFLKLKVLAEQTV